MQVRLADIQNVVCLSPSTYMVSCKLTWAKSILAVSVEVFFVNVRQKSVIIIIIVMKYRLDSVREYNEFDFGQ